MEQKITPNLWFDGNAEDAVEFYMSVFSDGKVISKEYYPNSKEEGLADFQLQMAGKVLTIEFEIGGMGFVAINAGPEFKFTPAISFIVGCETKEEVDGLWEKLSKGGKALMPLDKYPFSERYGWIQDKYGLSWQIIFTRPEGDKRPKIVPSLLFVKSKSGKAREARDFYLSVFMDKEEGATVGYPEDAELGQKKGDLMFSDFRIGNMWIAAMDGGDPHEFDFNESVSFSIACKDQDEIDYYWGKLSVVKESEQCGWCKDKYGLSWQVVPENMEELMKKPNAFANLMEMKKIEIEKF